MGVLAGGRDRRREVGEYILVKYAEEMRKNVQK